jgi:NADPH:quinone reductase-like Zn-dependent oxidoreductase
MAVQLAKALGLYVVGVAGPSNVDWVKQQLGADEVLDYSKQVGHCGLCGCLLAAFYTMLGFWVAFACVATKRWSPVGDCSTS